ncbi:MAG: DUF4381 family protein [Opitutales bacterium]
MSVFTFLAQAEPAGLADIREPILFWPWWVWLLAALVVVAVAGLVWAFLRYRRQRAAAAALPPPPPLPAEWARAQFERIAAERAAMDDKTYVSALSDVLRGYLQRAFGLPATERTTEEFFELTTQRGVFAESLRSELMAFLERADLVKFARQTIASAQQERLLDEARGVVETAEASRPRENLVNVPATGQPS